MSKRSLYYLFFILISSLLIIQPLLSEGFETVIVDSHVSSSCTIFTTTIGDTVYFGNNEDYKLNNAYRWYMPAQNVTTTYFGEKEINGAVFFGFDNNNNTEVDGWEQGGMNEFGLCFDANGLPDIELNLDPGASYPYTAHALAQVLWDCRDVEDVIAWYQNIKWHGSLGAQIHYADNTGDAVVVSINSTGQWIFTRIDSTFLVSTNFNLQDTSHGYYPCSRYNTATQMLGAIANEEDLNVSICAEALYAVHQEGTFATKYSNICDPVNREFYFNSGDEFSSQDKFNLTAILADSDSFEQRNSIFGVSAISGEDILVKIEKIGIQFPTNTNTTEASGIRFLIVVVCLLLCIPVYNRVKK